MPPSKGKVSFDEEARKEFLTGFQRRKSARRKKAQRQKEHKQQLARVVQRKQLRPVQRTQSEPWKRNSSDGIQTMNGVAQEPQTYECGGALVTATVSEFDFNDPEKP